MYARNLFVFILCIMLTVTPTSAAAEYKIATVDINRVLNQSKKAVKKKDELQALSKKAQKDVESLKNKLKKTEDRIKSGDIKSDSAEADKFRTEAREFARHVKDTQEELKTKFLRLNKELTEEVLAKVKSYASANGIDIVLEKSNEGRSAVLFGDPQADITEKIISEMNS